MTILNKKQMMLLMESYPDGGIVFAEYVPDTLNSPLMVTDGPFGATVVIPEHGEVFDFDWNINEFRDNELFAVYNNADILQMIQTLTKGCRIELVEE